jgi:alpha-mannosidase
VAVEHALEVCAVRHTHWDREWYHSAPRFRQRLVALVDALLLSFDKRGRTAAPFLLDGQAVVLEDYLAVRPEAREQVGRLLAARRLEAGPWYVLADNLIPSGEAIARNLLAGRQVLACFGAAAPSVAYCPDTFGHPAAMPLIAHGFGLDLAVVWRGHGGRRAPTGDTFVWQSANGDDVVTYHLSADGYEVGSALPADEDTASARWNALASVLRPRSNVGVVLLPVGADHHAAQPDFDNAARVLARVALPDVVTVGSLSDFATRLLGAARARPDDLPTVRGELRDSYGFTWTLGGTLATRAHQKRNNARAERALVRDTEPWCVLAWLRRNGVMDEADASGRVTLHQAPVLLDAAWRTLLRAHPHDTLCGCSIDAVARAMDERVASASTQAKGIRGSVLAFALHHDVVSTRARPIVGSGTLVVRNRTARWRGGVAEIIVDETLADVPVGPSSAGTRTEAHDDLRTDVAAGNAVVSADAAAFTTGAHMPPIPGLVTQRVSSRVLFRRRESPQHYPDNDLVRAFYALAWLPPVPPLGLSTWRLDAAPVGADADGVMNAASRVTAANEATNPGAAHGVSVPSPVAVMENEGAGTVSNGLLSVAIAGGIVTLTHGARVIRDVLTLETVRDIGDSYTPAVRGLPERLEVTRVRTTARGPLRGSVALFFTTREPARKVHVRVTISLDSGAEYVRVDVAGVNRRRDCQLRLRFASDLAPMNGDTVVWADSAFGRVQRTPLVVPAFEQRAERVVTTMPMHRFVTVSDAERGVTVHSDGLAEVEVTNGRTVVMTLLRAIGQLSRNTLDERPGHAGWPAPIPLAQSQGKFRARFGVQLHAALPANGTDDAITDHIRDDIECASDALLLPLTGETWRDLANSTAGSIAGPLLEGDALSLSACKLSDDGDGIVLRCVNAADGPRAGAWVLPPGMVFEAVRARLDETPLGEWAPITGRVGFTASARGVETIRVRRAR